MSYFNAETTSSQVAAALSDQVQDKTVLITGCSPSSLGLATALAVASQHPGLIILAGRSRASVLEAEKELKLEFPKVNTRLLIFDLADLGSIRRAAAEVNSYKETLEVLINNAAVMACQYEKTVDGFEMQFATNHLGPFLLTNLLLSKAIRNSGFRIVNVTSGAYQMNGINWETPNPEGENSYSKFVAYAQTKTANILFSISLATKLGAKGILAFSADPGSCLDTNIGRFLTDEDRAMLANIPMKFTSTAVSSASQVRAAFDPSLVATNGGHLKECQVVEIDDAFPWAKGAENANRLWSLSEELVGQKFAY